MTDSYVLIMERCPFPGYWQPVATCFLQDAEFRTQINRRHYHEHVKYVGDRTDRNRLYLYPEHIAKKLIADMSQQRDYAEYALLFDI